MCRTINQGSDLPSEMVIKVYNNVKKNKINTFRDRKNMLGISPENFLIICRNTQEAKL